MEEAATLRDNATDVQEAIADIEGYLQRLRDLAIEVSTQWGMNQRRISERVNV